jgi:hypothetical protein
VRRHRLQELHGDSAITHRHDDHEEELENRVYCKICFRPLLTQIEERLALTKEEKIFAVFALANGIVRFEGEERPDVQYAANVGSGSAVGQWNNVDALKERSRGSTSRFKRGVK